MLLTPNDPKPTWFDDPENYVFTPPPVKSFYDDLTDLLVDAQSNLDGAGLIWVLTPKARTTGAVPAAEVEEAAATAGMHATSAASMGQHWSGIRVSSRGR